MLALISKLWDSIPGWAKGIIGIILTLGWVLTQVQVHQGGKDRAELWKGFISVQETVDHNAAATTNPALQPEYVEQNKPADWADKKP